MTNIDTAVERLLTAYEVAGGTSEFDPADEEGLGRLRSVISGSPRSTKSSAGNCSSVSRGIGVTCVPKARVIAPRLRARNAPYISLVSVGAVTCVR